MSIFKLKSKYKASGDQPKAIKKLIEGVKKGYRYQTLLGVTGSGKTFSIASTINHFNMPVLVIAPNKALAAQLYREYKNFFPQNSVNYFVSYYDYYQPEAYLPITDTYIEKEAMINEEIDRLRHQATSALMTRNDVIIVASVSCIYNLGVPLNYLESAIHLEINKSITRGDLIRQLVRVQFLRTKGAVKRGCFRIRGDVFEIMPASSNIIYRIEFDKQKIKEIALADPLTRKIREGLKEIVIFPPKHFISNRPKVSEATKEIKEELKERIKYFKDNNLYLEAERLNRRTLYDIEMFESIGYCHGIENYSRHLTGKLAGEPPDTLLSYFPYKDNIPQFLTIIDESHISLPQIRGMYEGDRSRKEALIQYGWRLPSALDNRPLKFSEFEQRIGQVIFTSATPGDFELKKSSQIVEQIIRPTGLIDPPVEIRPVFEKDNNRTQIDDLIEELEEVVKKNERAIINTLTKKMAEDLYNFLKDKGFKVNYLHSEIKTLQRTVILTDFRKGKFNILVGVNLLREGLDLPEVTLVAILDADREGFLRSETSLIQTMGRAARNVLGKVILYADNITGSIKKATEEVERRRKKQIEYNVRNKIKPKSIRKSIENLIDIE
ncbi:MAG: excinuclease ABC subunit UvrB [Candidatus Pacebacteria bacterium]|nr:excinuclease ABC subunit UvrB [Candidatus Paceibacterota bacterium]